MMHARLHADTSQPRDHSVIQRLASLRYDAHAGSSVLISEVLTILAESLDAGLVFLARIEDEMLRIIYLRDMRGIGLMEGDLLPLNAGSIQAHAMDESGADAIEDALNNLDLAPWLSADQQAIGSSSGAPLYHGNGMLYGALCIHSAQPRDLQDLDHGPLRMAGRMIIQAIDSEAAEERERQLLQEVVAVAQRTRLIYDAMPCGVLVLDAGGMIIEANWAAQRMLGVSTEDLLGRAPEQVHQGALLMEDGTPLPDQSRPEVVALETYQPLRNLVCGLTRLDGDLRWLQFDALPLLDASGDLDSVVLSFFDISERIRAEAGRRMSEQRFRALVEHAPVSMCITDEHGMLETVNDAFCALYGYSQEDLIDQPFTRLIPEGGRDDALSAYAQALEDQEISRSEEDVVTKAGEPLVMLSTSVPLPGAVGERKRATFAVDITQRKRSEQRMRHMAHYDALTGLANRVLFRERLGRALVEVQQRRETIAVLFLDLDGFKEVNDTYGHDAGDQILCEVAACLRRCTRELDLVARLAGDEFTVILHDIGFATNAAAVAQKILGEISAGFMLRGTCLT